jgi:DNA-binding NtrC family response regulator
VGMTIGDAERVLIEATLAHAGMNKTRAASILDISTKTLHAKLRQYRLESGEPGGDEEMSSGV